ncbi:hypothetical protein [Wolbachia endosymbiont of Atemnus politus]|nr:hypothetical protein [Wolbachia endosymbiont of Atemnus politus]
MTIDPSVTRWDDKKVGSRMTPFVKPIASYIQKDLLQNKHKL